MSDAIAIQPTGPLRGIARPPGSKSITNRALVCAALARGTSTLEGALDSDDTRVMLDALRQLGIDVQHDAPSRRVRVVGCGGKIPASGGSLFVGNSGTTIRFLTPLVALAQGTFRLDGVPRMRQRPIGDLLAALQRLGVAAVSETGNDCPPVVVLASGLPGGHTEVSGSISSQFLSGLLLAAPYASRAVELTVTGSLVSQPYVAMTLAVMRGFGVDVAAADDLLHFCVPQAAYRGIQYAIEPDASAASYFFAAAAITRGKLTVPGLSLSGSLQGDVAFAQVLEQMGCTVTSTADGITVSGENLPGGELRGIEVDMNAISDTVQTLGAVALFARGTTTIRGVAHIRHKETDRIGALATELRKCGATVDELADGLRITPASLHGAEIDTYDDHRMAMSLALIGLRVPGIVIRDPGCTSKTYPEFFTDLAGLY